MSGFMFSGPLSETRKQFWTLARNAGRRGGNLDMLQDSGGMFVWGHAHGNSLVLLVMLIVFAGIAWWLGGGRFDRSLWPVWAMAGVFALAILANLLFVERFVLDANTRRWQYRRGWRLFHVRSEGGPFSELAGLSLREYRRPLPDRWTFWVLSLDFADGLRFLYLSPTIFEAGPAHELAQRLAKGTALPLTITPLAEP